MKPPLSTDTNRRLAVRPDKLWFILIGIALSLMLPASCSASPIISVCFDEHSEIISYGFSRLETALTDAGYTVIRCPSQAHHASRAVVLSRSPPHDHDAEVTPDHIPPLPEEGYAISIHDQGVYILAGDETGCLYGIMDVREQIEITRDLNTVAPRRVTPGFSLRAIKFNLPWSPYRPGPATELHRETCRDLKFWEAFLDMMVDNRFNALTLWNTHPFPYLIRATNFPEATPFSDEELADWKRFWQALFAMAKARGIETYLVNWNIVVSPEFARAYGAKVHDDRSELVKTYTRESVTQLIDEYEDLTGLGVTLADWMGNWGDDKMAPAAREDWIQDTFVEGMKAAGRKVRFIHRAVLAGDPSELRRVIRYAGLPTKTIVEVKFNWSHGHSTPSLSLTHANDEGTIMRGFWDPAPDDYFVAWMVRNEDFFVLRWGEPDFIRAHLKANHHAYVDGYFIGSEGYIPAVDYSHIENEQKTWRYAFEKQWLYYRLWGRLLYNPQEPDDLLKNGFAVRYPGVDAAELLHTYSLASQIPLWLASFYKGTWDFTLYSEGFLAPWQNGHDDGKSPFISLEELIEHETLDARYLSIREYCELTHRQVPLDPGRITPLALAATVEDTCNQLMSRLRQLRTHPIDPTLASELDDLETWGWLGYYFASKVRAGVAYTRRSLSGGDEEKSSALAHLENGKRHWEQLIRLTEHRYQPMPYVSMGHHEQKWPEFTSFHWKQFLPDVEADLDWVRQSP